MSASTLNPTPLDHLSRIIGLLKRAISSVGARQKLDLALQTLLATRLNRLLHRLQSITHNPLPPPAAPTRPRAEQAPKPDHQPDKPGTQLKIPTSKNWLLTLLPGQPIGESRAQFYDLIQRPEMIALVAQTPQLARQILRPLCRFFSLAIPAYLQLPARPRKPRPYRPRKPKPKPIKPPKPPEPTFLDYLLAKYPPIDEPAPYPFNPNQIRKIFSR